MLEHHHTRAPGRVAGDLHRVFDRLGAAVGERGLLGKIPRRDLVELLAELEVGLVHRDREAGMGELRHLLLRRAHHLVVGMPDVERADAAREVDEHVAVDVGEQGAMRARGEDRDGIGDAARDRLLAPGESACDRGPGMGVERTIDLAMAKCGDGWPPEARGRTLDRGYHGLFPTLSRRPPLCPCRPAPPAPREYP